MFMTRVLSINNLQTRVVLAAHKADVLSPSIALLSSPAPSHQRPSLPRCILVCIISSSSSSPSFILNLKSHSLALACYPISPHHREHPSQRIHHYRERLAPPTYAFHSVIVQLHSLQIWRGENVYQCTYYTSLWFQYTTLTQVILERYVLPLHPVSSSKYPISLPVCLSVCEIAPVVAPT